MYILLLHNTLLTDKHLSSRYVQLNIFENTLLRIKSKLILFL